ncbi:hypothetical protein EON67_09045 [archaeon]|nr:MAG: hypothetical protein EON67_09045 [archaeon]
MIARVPFPPPEYTPPSATRTRARARTLQETLKIMAKSYVRSQRQIRKFMLLKTHLQGLSMQLTV